MTYKELQVALINALDNDNDEDAEITMVDENDNEYEIGEVSDLESGRRYRLSAISRFDTELQINSGTQIVEEIRDDGTFVERARLPVKLRYLFPHEIFSMLEETPVAVENAYGSFDRTPLDETSEEMIFVASLPE